MQKHTDCDLVRSGRVERRFLPRNSETWMNGKWVCVQQTGEKKCRVCVVEKAHWVGWGLGVDGDGAGMVAGVDAAGVVAVVVIATRISTGLVVSVDTTAPSNPSHTPPSLENKRQNAYNRRKHYQPAAHSCTNDIFTNDRISFNSVCGVTQKQYGQY